MTPRRQTTTKDSTPTVAKLIRRTLPILQETTLLSDEEDVISANKVTGASINVPIAGTCQPTKVCIQDCYAGNNSQSWPSSLRKQARTQRAMAADPIAFAQRVAREYDRKRLTYLRWNGVGDLTPPAVEAVNWTIRERPDITLWIVTRIPDLAAQIEHGSRAFVHFSLDRYSLDRRHSFIAASPKSRNHFFSYQCERNEVAPPSNEIGASVLFYKRYKPSPLADLRDPALCPLNTLNDCAGACARCRRCFNGDAVSMRNTAENVSSDATER